MFSKQRWQVLYGGFVQTPSGDSERLWFLSDIFNAKIHKTAFSLKTYTVLNELLNCLQRESCSFGENYRLSFLTIVYNSPFIIRVYLGLILLESWKQATHPYHNPYHLLSDFWAKERLLAV